MFKFDFNQIWYQTYFGQAYSDMAANKSIIVPDKTSTTLQKCCACLSTFRLDAKYHYSYSYWISIVKPFFFTNNSHIFYDSDEIARIFEVWLIP